MITYRIRVVAERSIDVVFDKRDDNLACQIALDEAILEHAEASIERVVETTSRRGKSPSYPLSHKVDVQLTDDEDRPIEIDLCEQVCTDCDSTCGPICMTCPCNLWLPCGSYNLR